MKAKRLSIRIFSLLLALLLLTAPVLAALSSGAAQLALLREIYTYISNYALYPAKNMSLDGVTAQKLEREAGLFDSLVESWLADDPYGYFFTREEYDIVFNRTGQVYGIGIQVDARMPLGVYIDAFLPGGGAERSNMEVGAQILFVDGVDITDAVYLEVRDLIVGERGTIVEIGYINPGSTQVFFEEIVRGPLNIANVQHAMIEGTDIGYISIDGFDSFSDVFDFDDCYNVYLPELGAKSVIIDLRGNPGGDMNVLLSILDCMLTDPGYLLCRLIMSDGEEEFHSFGWTPEEQAMWPIWQPEAIVILTNGRSASASEVFAGTLQAYGLAVVVGETTYGKSHSQYHIPLSSGDILIITSGRLELHKIGTYEGVGIIPDYEVKLETVTGAGVVSFPLDTSRALFRQSVLAGRITAVQERLALLGYYRTAPSGVFDGYTLWCLNRFQVANGLPQGRFANIATLRALDTAVMAEEFIVSDAQLEFAVGLLGRR